jgi:hypothetical protein
MCGTVKVGRTERVLATALSALLAALAFTLLAPASAAAAPTLRVRALENPPPQVEPGERFLVRVRVTRAGTGLRSGVLAYYLTPRARVGAGAVRLAGRTSLASLQQRREFERRVQIGVPRSVSEGRYFLTACVVVLRGSGAVTRRPCRVSQRRTGVVAAGTSGSTGTTGTTTTGTGTTGTTTTGTNTTGTTGGSTSGTPPDDDPDDPTRIAIFPWVTSGGFEENWDQGLLFAGLGFVGALVLLFLSFGDFLPSMGGKAEYLARKAELDELVRRRADQFALREKYITGDPGTTPEREAASATLTDDLETAVQQKQQEVSHERNRMLWTGMAMYALLGAAFAVLFGANALQAILIGFGWTAVAERIGLKSELDELAAERKETIEELRQDAQQAVDEAGRGRRAAEVRAEENAKIAVGLGEALRNEADERKAAEQQLVAASAPSTQQTPPTPPTPPESRQEPG